MSRNPDSRATKAASTTRGTDLVVTCRHDPSRAGWSHAPTLSWRMIAQRKAGATHNAGRNAATTAWR